MEPQDREETYLANAAGQDVQLPPCPWDRKEAYLADIGDRLDGIEEDVETLKNNPDVVDIVDTYADLQAYDKTKLTDNDIIRVLNDETKDGESTYYRYSAAAQTFNYIGTTKQYTNFVGTDGTTAGEAGLVPAPAATDAGKFLKADGTWGEAGGGGITELTTADYNWNSYSHTTADPDCIALWKLPVGVYKVVVENHDYPSIAFMKRSSSSDKTVSLYDGDIIVCSTVYNDTENACAMIYTWRRGDPSATFRPYFIPTYDGDLSYTTLYGDTITLGNQYFEDFAMPMKIDNLATDKTFTGATTQMPGRKGLVPAPTAGSNNKVLLGDGSWKAWDQADYDESNTTANAYIKHRPFYDETVESKTTFAGVTVSSQVYDWNNFASNDVRTLIQDNLPALVSGGLFQGLVLKASSNTDIVATMTSQIPISTEEIVGAYIDPMEGTRIDYTVKIEDMVFTQDSSPTTGGDVWYAQVSFKYSTDGGSTFTTKDAVAIFGSAQYLDPTAGIYPSASYYLAIIPVGYMEFSWFNSFLSNPLYTSAIVHTLKQLDAKFVPVDNSTITVNAQGKLEVSSSGPTVVQTTGTSTTDAMSQVAVSQMIFPSGYETSMQRIRIGNSSGGSGGTQIGKTIISSSGTGSVVVAPANSIAGSRADSASSVVLGDSAEVRTNSRYSIAIGYGANVPDNSGDGAIALGYASKATRRGEMNIGTPGNTSAGYNNSAYRLLTGLYDPQSAHDAATKGYVDGTTETLTIADTDWSALSSSDPYTYSATVSVTATIGANSTVELINDNAVSFGTYGFAIGSVDQPNNQITVYSIGSPSVSVNLKINVKGA